MEKHLDKIAVDFFIFFSRLEYSLKAAGYNNGEGDAEVDWRKFAESVEHVFTDPASVELGAAIDFILNEPPKKQIIRNGILEWSSSKPSTNLNSDLTLIYIRRVRNNLFHGGKFNDHWFSPERSEPLIKNSLIILRACLKANKEVNNAFRG